MKKIMLIGLVLLCGAALSAGGEKFKFLANCNVDGKEIKDVHVHDITYDTMAFCETGKDLKAKKDKVRFTRKCNEKAKSKSDKTTFSLYCVKA